MLMFIISNYSGEIINLNHVIEICKIQLSEDEYSMTFEFVNGKTRNIGYHNKEDIDAIYNGLVELITKNTANIIIGKKE